MEEPLNIDELPCDLMVNGLRFQAVHIRYVPDSADNFQLVLSDPILGAFALHAEFELVMRDEGSCWRPVTLEQLTKILLESGKLLRALDVPKSLETVEHQMFDRLHDIDFPHRKSPRKNKLTGHDECVREVQKVLREARVPHQVAGTVFVVPCAFRTRICLIRAGFRKSTISPGALIEPRSGCAIQLVERPM